MKIQKQAPTCASQAPKREVGGGGGEGGEKQSERERERERGRERERERDQPCQGKPYEKPKILMCFALACSRELA